MNFFFKLTYGIIFLSLITSSIQPVFATDLTDIFVPTSIRDSEYQFHLQVIIRDADGKLISVIEATHGYYIPHSVTDNAFDNHFGEKEIVTIGTTTYEKVQYYETYSLDLPGKLMFFIPAILEVSHGSETVIVDAYIFQALVPLVYLAEDDEINTQWTIFRKLN